MNYEPDQAPLHSAGWIAQVWISFCVAIGAGVTGIYLLPASGWVRGFIALSFAMVISSSIALAKTVRDVHESSRLIKKVDEAKLNKFLVTNGQEL